MNTHLPKVLHAIRDLLCYPDQHTMQTCELLYVLLQGELSDAARRISAFGEFVDRHEAWEVEEAFTRTFDVNPACALEVGWHLFGEEYARGMFLVRMREEMRRFEIPESAELPDHICHVLDIVSAMPTDESQRFVKACVQPAVQTMHTALSDTATPYAHVMGCLADVLAYAFGEAEVDDDPAFNLSRSVDPLHAFPVADVGACDGNSCCSQPELVPLQIASPTDSDQDRRPLDVKEP